MYNLNMNLFNIRIKVSTLVWLSGILTSAAVSLGEIGKPIRVSNEEKLKSFKNPNSCESIYYKLGEQNKVTTTLNDLQTQFKNVRLLYNENIDRQMKEPEWFQALKKMKTEINAVQLDIYSRPLKKGEQGAIMRYKYEDQPNTMQINRRTFENRPEAVNVFWMGHEFTHASNWVPPQVAECLRSSSSYGARQNSISIVNNKDKDLEDFWNHLHSFSEKKSTSGRDKLRMDDKNSDGVGGGYLEGDGTDAVTKFELLAQLDVKTGQLLIDILEGKKKFTALSKPEVEHLSDVATYISMAHPNIGDQFMTTDNRWMNGSFKWIKGLPSQMDEAFADYQGVSLAVDYINKKMKTPGEKREAALAILRSFPPELYTDEVHSLMSRVGAKKPNEDRVLRILLANPDFRSFLGCEFETKPEPKLCPLVASQKSAPTQNVLKPIKKAGSIR
jgi:hypothetical protein